MAMETCGRQNGGYRGYGNPPPRHSLVMGDDRHQRSPRQRAPQAAAKRRDIVPDPQPPLTEDDIRRAEELVEKYGLQHLRNKS